MAKKEWAYRGKTLEELQALPDNEMIELIPSNSRRKLKRVRPETIQGKTMKKIYENAGLAQEKGRKKIWIWKEKNTSSETIKRENK